MMFHQLILLFAILKDPSGRSGFPGKKEKNPGFQER